MAKTYQSINLDSTSGGTSSPPYSQSFLVGAWGLDGSSYKIDILEGTHDQGVNLITQVYELISGEYREIEADIITSITGNVTIQISSSPDLRFNGKIVIKGE